MIQDFRGKSFVSIREFYQKDGKQLPSNKGDQMHTSKLLVITLSEICLPYIFAD